MLGLRIALSVAKGVIDEIGGLLSKLARRSTYSENLADSRAVISDIDSYDLLDKATILLTPTATSNARVHSVKTYTGDELVTNETSKSVNTGGVYTDIITNINATSGQKLQITYTLTGIEGNMQIWGWNSYSNTYSPIYSTDGTYTAMITVTSNNASLDLRFYSPSGRTGTISNISVVDVSSDFDFDRASSATRINSSGLVQDMQSITDPELVLNGDFEELGDDVLTSTWVTGTGWSVIADGVSCDGSNGNVRQNIEMTDYNGKTFLLTYTLSNVTDSTTLNAKFGGGSNVALTSTNGTHTVYLTNDATVDNFQFTSGGNWAGDITNISLKQVDPNDRWSLGTGWSIEDGKAIYTGTTNANLTEGGILTSGNLYELNYEVINSTLVGGVIKLSGETASAQNVLSQTVGTHKLYFTADGTSPTDFVIRAVINTSGQFEIDNISVKDITFSTDVDLARINYDGNGANGHILLEPTSTNLLPYSEDFSKWASSNATLESGFLAPDGSNSAYKVSGTVGSTTVYFSGVPNLSSTSTRTIWAKTVSGTGTINLCSYGDNSNNNFTITEEWQRFEVNGTTTSTGESNFYAADFRFNQPNALTEIIIWGAQAEALSYATSYIPTLTGSTVTRAAETLTGSGNSTLINSTEGVLYAEIAALADDLTRRIITITDGTLNNIVKLEYKNVSNQIEAVVYDGDTECLILHTLSDETEFNKIAFKYKQDDFSLFVNGIKVGTDTSGAVFTPNTLNDLNFYQGSSNNLYGKVKALAVFDEALTDDELELLTGITNYGSFNELAQANGYTII